MRVYPLSIVPFFAVDFNRGYLDFISIKCRFGNKMSIRENEKPRNRRGSWVFGCVIFQGKRLSGAFKMGLWVFVFEAVRGG